VPGQFSNVKAVATDKQPPTPPTMSALSADVSIGAGPSRSSTRARRTRVTPRGYAGDEENDVGAFVGNDENLSSAISDDDDEERREVHRRRRQQRASQAPSKASLANVRAMAAGTPRTAPVWPALPKFYSKNDGVQVRDEDAAAELLFELACRSSASESSESRAQDTPANADDPAWRRASFVVVV